MTLPDAALLYIETKKWSIFPVAPNAKTPLTQHGVKDASSDPAQVREWWQEFPKANIGLACGERSGVFVLDFDVKDDKRGDKTLEMLQWRFGLHTLSSETPSSGIHKFFKYVPGLRNAVEILPGLDVRTAGGYVVVAPSVVDGKRYRWIEQIPTAMAPAELIALLQKPKSTSTHASPPRWMPNRLELIERARRYVAAVPGAIQGESGDLATYKLACRLVRGFALTGREALALMMIWNQRCQPAWSELELLSKIGSAERNGLEPIGARLEVRRQK